MHQVGLKALVQAKKSCTSQCIDNASSSNCDEKKPNFSAQGYAQGNQNRDSVYREVQQRLRYNALLKREQAAEAWMDDPRRTDAEVEKWLPLFQEILAGLNSLINEIGLNHCSEEERLHGFDVMPLLGTEVSLNDLPEEWQGGVN